MNEYFAENGNLSEESINEIADELFSDREFIKGFLKKLSPFMPTDIKAELKDSPEKSDKEMTQLQIDWESMGLD